MTWSRSSTPSSERTMGHQCRDPIGMLSSGLGPQIHLSGSCSRLVCMSRLPSHLHLCLARPGRLMGKRPYCPLCHLRHRPCQYHRIVHRSRYLLMAYSVGYMDQSHKPTQMCSAMCRHQCHRPWHRTFRHCQCPGVLSWSH